MSDVDDEEDAIATMAIAMAKDVAWALPTPSQLRAWKTEERAYLRQRQKERKPELEEAGQAIFKLWEERDKFDPDCYFRIPEFGVMPADVAFHGFEGPVFYFDQPALAAPIRRMVTLARKLLVRDGIATLAEAHEQYLETFDLIDYDDSLELVGFDRLTPKHRTAMAYFLVLHGLTDFLRRDFADQQLTELAEAGEQLAFWAAGSADAALERISQRNRQNRENALGPRVPVTAEDVAAFADLIRYPDEVTYEVFVECGAAAMPTSKSTFERRYIEARDLGLTRKTTL